MVEQDAFDQFWKHATTLYAQPNVEEALLRLQDERGADIPLMLCILWLNSIGRTPDDVALKTSIAFSNKWREARVSPLRTLRRAWKGSGDPLVEAARQEVAAAEQALEKLQMERLVELLGCEGSVEGDISAEVAFERYAEFAGISLPQRELQTLLDAI